MAFPLLPHDVRYHLLLSAATSSRPSTLSTLARTSRALFQTYTDHAPTFLKAAFLATTKTKSTQALLLARREQPSVPEEALLIHALRTAGLITLFARFLRARDALYHAYAIHEAAQLAGPGRRRRPRQPFPVPHPRPQAPGTHPLATYKSAIYTYAMYGKQSYLDSWSEDLVTEEDPEFALIASGIPILLTWHYLPHPPYEEFNPDPMVEFERRRIMESRHAVDVKAYGRRVWRVAVAASGVEGLEGSGVLRAWEESIERGEEVKLLAGLWMRWYEDWTMDGGGRKLVRSWIDGGLPDKFEDIEQEGCSFAEEKKREYDAFDWPSLLRIQEEAQEMPGKSQEDGYYF